MSRTFTFVEAIPFALTIALVFLGAAAVRADFPEVSKLPSRPEIPDPLVMLNGDRVTTKEQWVEKRRPELKELFQYYMYGFMPPAPARVEAKVDRVDAKAFGGKATLKEATVSFGPPDTPPIHLLLVVPNSRKGPAPVFLGMNFSGNHQLINDPAVRLPTVWMPSGPSVKDNRATDAGRGLQVETQRWSTPSTAATPWLRSIAATLIPTGLTCARASSRISARTASNRGRTTGEPSQPGPGVSSAVDYLRTDKDIDKDHIAVVGHSRLGKAAIVAGAFDERIALVIPLQAGCGGTSPSRGKVGESVKAINQHFPHWFDATFKEFNDQPERLPFDQNCLAARAAPRPLLYCCAVEDEWSNPPGQFEMLQSADAVYRLLGAGGLESKQMPEVGRLSDGQLGYYIRPGKHSMTKGDWKIFLDYADKHWGKPGG